MNARKYRKKPVVIEAMQWDGTRQSIESICGWVNSFDSEDVDPPTMQYEFQGSDDVVGEPRIWTLEGDLNVSPDDYVIRGVQGEFYPCKPAIFAATYEEVE